jgi:hypothetical protein
MKRFYCTCGSEIFFDNRVCLHCGQTLGFDPLKLRLFTLQMNNNGTAEEAGVKNGTLYKLCEHSWQDTLECNWLIIREDMHSQCISCRLTRIIPDQSILKNKRRWQVLEAAKRRVLYNLFNNRLTFSSREEDTECGLAFDFLEDKRSNPNVDCEHIYTGHNCGLITINAAEADPEYRVSMREEMNERYRTNLGHFRHEIGHYYWMRLVKGRKDGEFKALFGDPEADYDKALKNYYAYGPRNDWQEHHISAYASMHPLEDWAETWAHFLHLNDTMETAISFGILNIEFRHDNFREIISKWVELTVTMNALNRSVGKFDAYPFVISNKVFHKLEMVRKIILEEREQKAPALL